MSYPTLPPPGYPAVRPDHPRATTAMVLGILGFVVCGICAPFAWSIGGKAVKEIDASGGAYGGRGQAQAGYVMGIIGTVLLGLSVVGVVLWLVFVVVLGVASTTSGP
jgi:hypothetical protein